MSELAVLLDMDKTVLPTDRFVDDLTTTLEVGLGVDRKLFKRQMPSFYVGGKDERALRYYDFFAHLEYLDLDADRTEALVLEELAGRDYVYDDVPPFLDFLAAQVQPGTCQLLTYGERRFQRLKYTCAPTLGRLAFVETLRPKGEYITAHFAEHPGIIIDDKLVDGLPSSFRHIWLTRVGISSGKESYDSLNMVREQWEEITE